jgi:hypothetical protein
MTPALRVPGEVGWGSGVGKWEGVVASPGAAWL